MHTSRLPEDISVLPNEDAELVDKIKARFRRRLRERWNCKVPEHTHCYADLAGAHVPLSDEVIEVWVLSMCNGEATLLNPPESVVQMINPSCKPDADAMSATSMTSNDPIQYQRELKWRRHPSLTDIRSAQFRLRESIFPSPSASMSSFSSTSSGVAGIGHSSGIAVKWVGLQILNAFDSLEMRRRRWIIQKILKKIEKIPADKRAAWLLKNERKMNRVFEDLLELSLEHYKPNYQARAVEQGQFLRRSIKFYDSDEQQASIGMLQTKTFPLGLLLKRRAGTDTIARSLRETLLQDPLDSVDEDSLLEEIAAQICFELAYGPSLNWWSQGFVVLSELYTVPRGRKRLIELGQNATLMRDMATRAFEQADSENVPSRWQHPVIDFFVGYANDVPTFRHYLMVPMGIPWLVQAIQTMTSGTINYQSYLNQVVVLSDISAHSWCLPALNAPGLCSSLAQLLVSRDGTNSESDFEWKSRTPFSIFKFFHHLIIFGGDLEKQAVLDAYTDELRSSLPDIMTNTQRFLGESGVVKASGWIRTIWPGCEVV